ncbi:Relaxasome subunit MobC [Gammaproteobacteria bacterium]
MVHVTTHRLKRLMEQREKIDARIQAAEARIKSSERKKDVRKKILVGAYYLDIAIKENRMNEIKEIMDKYLTRDSDRILFDLSQLPEKI